ncbi:hypothetical protein CD30_04500 [Ureibacillus massiliensis 4400831 = CIP 108448 = CCUG 49529]|uniref:Uncharacterized protein n=1 Tax=Ureibacillus massiliensis 4400831 = CIP 108448 = CCUG 49529 TaxID=1211035 RepID=A0A0A3J3F4_9BACL|nr:hypothetical protein [Ureibacillus massiliensis]KGR91574.1 hypothetical protein CD30_04500 [Ureibacillus massiliensis 4400831 = CIP 108448 = CCUG 49529]
MFRNINEFINGGNTFEMLINYDFKNESPWESVRNETDFLQKFHNYKYQNKSNIKFDCDNSNGTCALTDSLYQMLWGWSYKNRYSVPEFLKEKFGLQWNRFGPDTMNSFATTYNQALVIYGNDENKVKGNPYLNQFAALTHSIGNFTLLPFKLNPEEDGKSFNQYRGANFGKYFVYDYFDLSLKLLKESVSDLVFKKCIDTFFLNDYVDANYNVKPLFKSHAAFLSSERLSLNNPRKFLPQNESELNEYLNNVIINIQARARRIVAELQKQISLPTGNSVNISKTFPDESGELPVSTSDNKVIASVNKIWQKFKKSNLGRHTLTLLGTFLFVFLITFVITIYLTISRITHVTLPELFHTNGVLVVLISLLEIVLPLSFQLAILLTLILYFFIWWIRKKLWLCPDCRRIFGMKKLQTVLEKSEIINIKVDLENRDLNGKIIGTSEQYISGKRRHYTIHHQCKFCGYKKNTFSQKNVPNT